MMDVSNSSIIQRLHKLKEAVSNCGVQPDTPNSSLHLVAQDRLLDAFVALYDECNNECFKKDAQINSFVEKYQPAIKNLKHVRVNLNDFEARKVIGKGHFGTVQVVKEKQTGNVHAMKTLRKSETLSQQHVAFYEEERDIMAKASSEWITKLQYAFQDDKNLYLVMDFHPGGDLLALLDRYDFSFTEEMVQFYIAEITVAIHAVHNMGYVHRDIKPDNILIDRLGHIKLADFGSAAKLSSSGLVHSKLPIGTPDYVAPEVLSSMNTQSNTGARYGIECDYWSIGVMSYEMIYSDTPFHGDQVGVTYSNIMAFKEKLKFDEETEISDDLKDLIQNLLQDADNRFGYNEISKHKFFLHTNWNDLQSVTPPFIPVVNSLDDTSNFEELEIDRTLPDIDLFMNKNTFSGKQLPFIGFTYTRPKPMDVKRVSLNSSILGVNESMRDPTYLEEQLKAKKKELHETVLRLKDLESRGWIGKVHPLEERAVRAETRAKLLEDSKVKFEENFGRLSVNLEKTQKLLAKERELRVSRETKTLEYLREHKKKWNEEQENKIKPYKEKLEIYRKTAEAIHKAKDEALEKLVECTKQLNEARREEFQCKKTLKDKEDLIEKLKKQSPVDCKGTCSDSQNLKSKLDEAQIILEKEISKSQNLSDKIHNLEESISSQKQIIDTLNNEKDVLSNETELLRNQLQNKELEIKRTKKQLQDLREQTLVDKENQIKEIQKQLIAEKSHSCKLQEKIKEISSKLDVSCASLDSRDVSFQARETELQNQLQELQNELKETCRHQHELERQLTECHAKEGSQSMKISELETLLHNLNETLENMKSKQTIDGEENLKAQMALLEKQLASAQATGEADREKLHSIQKTNQQVTSELRDVKLDLRVCERELKSSQETIKYYRETNKELREQLKEKDDSLNQLSQKEGLLNGEIENLKLNHNEELKQLQQMFDETQLQLKTLQDELTSLKESKSAESQELQNLKKQLKDSQALCDTIKLEKINLANQVQNLKEECTEQQQRQSSTYEQVEVVQNKLKEAEERIEKLKGICELQDEQLSMLDEVEQKLIMKDEEKNLLMNQVQTLEKLVKESRAATNEEISLKLFQEKRVGDLEKKISKLEDELDTQTITLQQARDEHAKELHELKSLLTELENEITDGLSREKSMEHQLIDLDTKLTYQKEESLGHIEHIHTLKESNFKLTDGLDEAISKGELFKKKIIELESQIDQAQVMAADKELRNSSTIQQQAKLIEFLQSKTENPPKKKHTLTRLFRGGGNNKENTVMVTRQNRDLESNLSREKTINDRLSSQLSKAHSEIVSLKAQVNAKEPKDLPRITTTPLKTSSPKRKLPLDEIANSPNVYEKKAKQRMRHKIPHRWHSLVIMKPIKCCGCMGSIPFSRTAVRCLDCSVVAHTKCSTNIAHTCGLPQEFANHFTASCKSPAAPKDKPQKEILQQGWVKIPKQGKACWEKKFAQLTADAISIYDQEPYPSMKPLHTLDLNAHETRITVAPTVPKSELPNTLDSELPFILKLDITKKSDPVKDHLYILTGSFPIKQTWLEALEPLLSKNFEEEEPTGTLIVHPLSNLNSATQLECNSFLSLSKKTVLVGASQGLFSFSMDDNGEMKFRARIEGIGSVHQIILVKEVNIAVFIAGKDNHVYENDLRTLAVAAEALPVAKPSISPKQITPLVNCHLVTASSNKNIYLCAAASDRISILMWNFAKVEFEVCRQYSTGEACSCLLFTSNTLIVGAERFYGIDLKNYEIEEYLDESDTSLAYAVHGSTSNNSFPVAIIQVSPLGAHEEFLLAFYEFGIFVDSKGRRTREFDIRFTQLPLNILYIAPCLYILHESTVEVIEVKRESFTRVRGQTFDSETECSPIVRSIMKKFEKPRFLGVLPHSKFVVASIEVDSKINLIKISASFPLEADESSVWSINTSRSLQSGGDESMQSEPSTITVGDNSSFEREKKQLFTNFLRGSKRSKKNSKIE